MVLGMLLAGKKNQKIAPPPMPRAMLLAGICEKSILVENDGALNLYYYEKIWRDSVPDFVALAARCFGVKLQYMR